MSNLGTSVIRTVTPILVGWLMGVLAERGLDIDEGALSGAVSSGLAVAYYVVVRLLEQRKASFGWLLGYASQPGYLDPPPAPPPPGTE